MLVKKAGFDPTRFRFNLDKKDMSAGLSVLIHGNFAAGKTHLIGDMLKHEAGKGGSVAFINLIGEDGSSSVSDMGLGDAGYNVSSRKELYELLDWFATNEKLVAIGLDSVLVLQDYCKKAIVGATRWDSASLEISPAEWANVHRALSQTILKLKTVATWVMCVCTSDISVDIVAKETQQTGGIGGKGAFVSPSLSGKAHSMIAASFDMVGFMKAEIMGNTVKRKVTFKSSNTTLTRQRLAQEINEDIVIPHGGGGWAAIKSAIEKAQGKPTPKEVRK